LNAEDVNWMMPVSEVESFLALTVKKFVNQASRTRKESSMGLKWQALKVWSDEIMPNEQRPPYY